MIRFLKGIVEEAGADALTLDVNGVGYRAFCSARTMGQFTLGEVIKLHTHTLVREDSHTLYGFSGPAERTAFEALLTVGGVGARVALAILSALTPQEVAQAVTMQDGKMLARANGVGPKLGERIVRELKGKLAPTMPGAIGADGATVQAAPPSGGPLADVFSALTNLGYRPADANRAVMAAQKIAGESATFDQLLKTSLAELR